MQESGDMRATSHASFSVKTPPKKLTNAERRSREYLTPHEVEHVLAAARKVGRHPRRDATLMRCMYRHGLRVSEAVSRRWEAVDLQAGCLHVHRINHGHPAVHPLRGPELRALRQVRRDSPETPYLLVSERGGPLTARAVRHSVLRAGEVAGLTFPIHPHILRHACGVYLANQGIDTRAIQQYVGHGTIQHTVRYTALTPQRVTDFWRD
jgi:site-specific recombinase XerD